MPNRRCSMFGICKQSLLPACWEFEFKQLLTLSQGALLSVLWLSILYPAKRVKLTINPVAKATRTRIRTPFDELFAPNCVHIDKV